MRRFLAIFKKEFRQVRRDPLSLAFLLVLPALLLVMYGYALSFDVKHIRTGVLDLDRSPESRAFLDSLFQNPYFDRRHTLERIEEAEGLLARGRVRVVLVMPRGYAAGLARGEPLRVQALVDGSDATAGTTTVGYLEALADQQTLRWQARTASSTYDPLQRPRVRVESRLWFNPEMDSAHFLVPGLIGLLLMISAVIATSLSIVREKERETMEQIRVSPVRPRELILGKILPYAIICLVTMVLVLALGYVLFGVVIRGSLPLLGLTALLFLFAALGMGMLISSITRSQQVAFQVATTASLLPSIILSGLIFPIQSMPFVIQGITLLMVPRYFVAALRGIILKGATFSMIWPELLAMLVLGLAFNLVATRNLRKET